MGELGKTLRATRTHRRLELTEVASLLGIASKDLRALEWDRLDLLPDPGDAERCLQADAEFRGSEAPTPPLVGPLAEREARVQERAAAPAVPAESRARPRAARSRVSTFLLVLALVAAAVVASRGPTDAPTLGPPTSAVPIPQPARPAPQQRSEPASAAPRNPRRLAALEVKATRGDSWIEAHASSPRGPLLFRGVVARGRSLRFKGRILWLRLGAASNVDVRVNGRWVGYLSGTIDILATSQGISPA